MGMAASPSVPATVRTWGIPLHTLLGRKPLVLRRAPLLLARVEGFTAGSLPESFDSLPVFGTDRDIFNSLPPTQPETSPSPVKQVVVPSPVPSSGDGMPRTPAAPAATALRQIVQAPEVHNAWYGPYIDFDAVVNTTVNAFQNITTNNAVTIIQNCGNNCTQNADASANAVTDTSQAINALTQNQTSIQQTGTESASQSATVPADAVTNIQSTINAVSSDSALVVQQ